MPKTTLEEFPTDILTDARKSHEAVFVHPDQSIWADASVAEAFQQVDAAFLADPEARIRFMADNVKHIKVPGTLGIWAPINMALETDDRDADIDEIGIESSPLNDGRPKSSADRMIQLINTPEPSFAQIALARPNSWGPLVKLDTGFEFGHAAGRPMSRLQTFSRVPPRAMTARERLAMWQGDWAAHGRIALEGVKYVNAIRRQQGKNLIRKAHFFGAGMAQKALAAAAYFAERQEETGIEVASVTAMNLALRRGVVGTAIDHMRQRKINEPSGVPIPEGHVRIEEAQLRKQTDKHTDTLQMYGRQAWAIKDVSQTWAFMTKYLPTVRNVETLLDYDVAFRLVSGLNVAMTANTLRHLPIGDRRLKFSTIVGIEGQKVGMMSNEHAGVVAIAMQLGIKDYDELKQAA